VVSSFLLCFLFLGAWGGFFGGFFLLFWGLSLWGVERLRKIWMEESPFSPLSPLLFFTYFYGCARQSGDHPPPRVEMGECERVMRPPLSSPPPSLSKRVSSGSYRAGQSKADNRINMKKVIVLTLFPPFPPLPFPSFILNRTSFFGLLI